MKSFLIVLASLLGMILSSCSNSFDEPQDYQGCRDKMVVSLSGEEALSLMCGDSVAISSTLTDDEIIEIVQTFPYASESESRGNCKTFEIEKKYVLPSYNTLSRTSDIPRNVEFDVVKFEDSSSNGFAIVCADKRYPEVIAYVPGLNFYAIDSIAPVKFMIERGQEVALNYIYKCERITEENCEKTLDKVCKTFGIAKNDFDFDKYRSHIYIQGFQEESRGSAVTPSGTLLSQVGPLCGTTRIIQGWPCNQYMPKTTLEQYNSSQHNGHYPAGCVNVALATICAYLQPTIYSASLGRNINWDNVYNSYFNPFGFNPSQYSETTPQAIEVGHLLKILADGTNTKFGEDGGSTSTSNAASYMNKIGINMSSSTTTLNYANVRTSLSNLGLVYCTGTVVEGSRSNSSGGGHAWVIDGLQIRKPLTRMELQNYNCYASCKFGWIEWDFMESYNGWYLFDTSGTITFDFSDSYISQNLKCVPNIRRK